MSPVGELDREARRRGDGGDQRHAGEERLLDQLEGGRGPTPAGSTCRADAGRPAACGRDDLVDGVVAADVLRRQLQHCPDRSNSAGSMKAAGGVEHRLRRSQAIGQRRDHVGADGPVAAHALATRACSDSMVRRPQSPHDEVIVTWRRSPSRACQPLHRVPVDGDVDACCRGPRLRRPGNTQSCRSRRRLRITSSASRKPAARSRSAPGVRMITAKLAPLTRTSIGSSTADAVALRRRLALAQRSHDLADDRLRLLPCWTVRRLRPTDPVD